MNILSRGGRKRLSRCACLLMCAFMLAAAARPAAAQTLKFGERGAAVEQAKQRLYELKYYATKRYGKSYDAAMQEHVSAFQRINGLEITGQMDDTTWDALFSEDARSAWRSPVITEATASLYTRPELPEDFPQDLTPEGFRAEGEAPYVHADRDAGCWYYISGDVRIGIRRITEEVTPLVWFETDIRLGGDQRLRSLMNPKSKKFAARDPREIAEAYGAVLAFSDDFYGYRRTRGINNAGIVIREGIKLYERTAKSGTAKIPNLDVIALFGDGSMKTFQSKELSAAEYLAMGVTDTWAFGPILLRDGEIDERLKEDRRFFRDEDPRCAMGMIEPGHYLVLTVLGRQKTSLGVAPLWLAQRMKDLGCTEALNLDGGNSIALVFMGDMINKAQGADLNFMNGIRALTSMIGAGFTTEE